MKIRKKYLVILALIILFPAILFFRVKDLLQLTVPSNGDFSIPREVSAENVIPKDMGGSDYEDAIFNKPNSDWAASCLGALKLKNDIWKGKELYRYLCEGFVGGYMRTYDSYSLGNKLIKGVEGEKVLTIHVVEFKSPKDVKNAASFYTLESYAYNFNAYGLTVLGFNRNPSNTYYLIPLPYSNKLLGISGELAAVDDTVKKISIKYK